MLDKFRKDEDMESSKGGRIESSPDLPTIQENSEESSLEPSMLGLMHVQRPPKSILIRDVSDIYLTTTVETELRELTTKVSRDTVEQHARSVEEPLLEAIAPSRSPLETNNWNVIIRQREPYDPTATETDVDASGESNGESTDEPESTEKPHFDVKIRTIPPEELQPKKPDEMVRIPTLEMPKTVSKLREALAPKTSDEVSRISEPPNGDETPEEKDDAKDKPRTVRWMDDAKDQNPDEVSTVSSSDSFKSAASLRERSSSEVSKVAPTLPSQARVSRHPPMLERSTSEIVTSPEENVRWVGGVVPVLESLSPEFLANIPVVIQGGFFNRQKSPPPGDSN
ncbi:ZP domain-containing protein [Caerostris extrusa]|uniref:ZP domain-containing protein n=1 Tax=Caerostris extrusa TaxID=172846 RepID=A0AAV4Q4M3_CAEEX|nr:ZP domain-containing protein [Caerostris extrusa]